MLKQRIITALILAPIAIGCIFFLPPVGFAIFIAAVITIGAWEWANLAALSAPMRYVYAAVIAVLCLLSYFLPPMSFLLAAAAWWGLSLVFMLQYPDGAERWSGNLRLGIIGLFVLVPGFVALLTLRQAADPHFLILMLFFLIWGADIGAYFSGRALGKRKLAPDVSPGKTWAGFFGGLIVALGIAVAMLLWLGKPDLMSIQGIMLLSGIAIIVMVSVLGDLVMSMFKRNRGIKDSSNLLPGHGGVLDRIDSLLSAGPLFALLILITGWQ